MPEARAVPSASNMGKNKGGAYQDRDKPAQIRFSNISAAKGTFENLCDTANIRPPNVALLIVNSSFSFCLIRNLIHQTTSFKHERVQNVRDGKRRRYNLNYPFY